MEPTADVRTFFTEYERIANDVTSRHSRLASATNASRHRQASPLAQRIERSCTLCSKGPPGTTATRAGWPA